MGMGQYDTLFIVEAPDDHRLSGFDSYFLGLVKVAPRFTPSILFLPERSRSRLALCSLDLGTMASKGMKSILIRVLCDQQIASLFDHTA